MSQHAGAQTRRAAFVVAAVVALVAIVLAIAYSTGFGTKTQLTYLVEPLRRAHPELYRADWLVSQTTAYHSAFAWLAAWLFRIDDAGELAFFVAYAVVAVATYLALWRLVAAVAAARVLAVFLVIAGWLALTEGRALAGSYLWSGYLQPSSLATLGWLVALVAWLRGRNLVAGVALALAGLCHVNFAVLGVPLFGAAELLTSRGKRLREAAVLVVPSLAAIALYWPELTAGASDPALALRLLVEFHVPGHYQPYRIALQAPAFAAWLAGAWLITPVARGAAHEPLAKLWRFVAIAGTASLGAAAIIWIPALLPLTRLYIWRCAPFAQLGCELIVAIAACSIVAEPARARELPWWRRIAIVVVFAGLAAQRHITYPRDGYLALAVVAAAVLAARWIPARARALAPCAMGAIVCVLAIAPHGQQVFHPRISGPSDPIYAWARSATDPDAVFVTPPGLGAFRLLARRAVYADTWSPPLVPDELIAWYRRLCREVDLAEAKNHEQIELAWPKLPPARLLAIARELGARYLVVERGTFAPIDAPIAFDGSPSFIAYQVATP